MNYKNMSREQLSELHYHAICIGNLNAAAEISDFIEFYNKTVKVIKGRKIPIGTTGTCFWIKRYDNSKYGDPWGIYSNTRVGIKTADGSVHFTSADNVVVTEPCRT